MSRLPSGCGGPPAFAAALLVLLARYIATGVIDVLLFRAAFILGLLLLPVKAAKAAQSY